MNANRSSGLIAHLTSLPSRYGAGALGPDAADFLQFLRRAGQSLWQVLPVSPTGYGNSPYQSLSSFAGNPLLISLSQLAAEGWLKRSEMRSPPDFPQDEVAFDQVAAWREPLLNLACERFYRRGGDKSSEFVDFCAAQHDWLPDYALFRALKQAHQDRAWPDWESGAVHRDEAALRRWAEELREPIARETFLQFQFARQWSALLEQAHALGIRLIGDLPIFTAHDSADVWANQDLFHLNSAGKATAVAGVPPDYFSRTGQLWGNPLYRWDVLAASNYHWWVRRLGHARRLFDLVRIDHFRGFESYWEVPGDAPDASSGRWVPGPGAALFHAAEQQLGKLPVIAEDLGLITPAVEQLRNSLGFPGMRVLQFAFGDDPKGVDYLPHNYPHHCVVYTGTHDNDTTVGWFASQAGSGSTRSAEQIARERAYVLAYLGTAGRRIHWELIRLAWSSVAEMAMAPLQDLLGLGSTARMNLPGTSSGNWKWRCRPRSLTPKLADQLGELTALYGRCTSPRPWFLPAMILPKSEDKPV